MAGIRRIAGVAALAGSLLVAAGSAGLAQRSDGRTVTYHGLDFLPEFAEGRRISTRDYEAATPGLGFSAGYRHRNATSTVYIYDLGLNAIPDDIAAALPVRNFEQSRSDILKAQPPNVTVTSSGTFTLADAAGRPRLSCEGFTFRRGANEAPLDSYLCTGVVNGKFFKVRTTMLQAEDSQSEARRFIGAWIAKIWP
jgi:hypothetical protein